MSYANSEGTDERVLPCCLIWTSSVRRHMLEYRDQTWFLMH